MITDRNVIGLLGGTFDPVHNGHLHIALNAYKSLPLASVKLLPSYKPVHKPKPSATSEERVDMLRLAIQPYSMFSLELCEIQARKPCYTVDTLKYLHSQYADNPLCLLVGMDIFLQLDQWHRWQDLTSHAHIVVLSRAGYTLPSHINPAISCFLQRQETHETVSIQQPITASKPGKVLFHAISLYPLSAEAIRKRLYEGESCKEDLPLPVHDYILEHHLYKGPS
ncbi:MAG: nicotinic acid mononucleotide adenylyltransferase [Gammaproteobacteria bacterium]|jgi:nicotinate-nucleotide adenylyltransferase|nr:nicotinic acid mononucleotide adenylyltransferase [Gammaproteobacteria bacterium]